MPGRVPATSCGVHRRNSQLPTLCYTAGMGETLTIRLSGDLAEALRRESRLTGLAKGEIVRQAIRAHVQRTGTGSTMARYFGVMKGPRDLSTGKVYRRAWRLRKRQ